MRREGRASRDGAGKAEAGAENRNRLHSRPEGHNATVTSPPELNVTHPSRFPSAFLLRHSDARECPHLPAAETGGRCRDFLKSQAKAGFFRRAPPDLPSGERMGETGRCFWRSSRSGGGACTNRKGLWKRTGFLLCKSACMRTCARLKLLGADGTKVHEVLDCRRDEASGSAASLSDWPRLPTRRPRGGLG